MKLLSRAFIQNALLKHESKLQCKRKFISPLMIRKYSKALSLKWKSTCILYKPRNDIESIKYTRKHEIFCLTKNDQSIIYCPDTGFYLVKYFVAFISD